VVTAENNIVKFTTLHTVEDDRTGDDPNKAAKATKQKKPKDETEKD
jgi:hypothetical protein